MDFRKFACAGAMVLGFAAAAGAAHATVLDATARGSLTPTGAAASGGSGTAVGNYIVGYLGTNEINDYFVFDLSAVSGNINGATLTLNLASGGSGSLATPTLGIYDYTGSISDLVNATGGAASASDLGSGTMYGSAGVDVSLMDPSTAVITFNSAALAALNAAEGGQIAFGGSLTGAPMTNEYLFAASFGSGYQTQLDLSFGPSSPVPEPATIALFGVALAGFGAMRRRRRKA